MRTAWATSVKHIVQGRPDDIGQDRVCAFRGSCPPGADRPNRLISNHKVLAWPRQPFQPFTYLALHDFRRPPALVFLQGFTYANDRGQAMSKGCFDFPVYGFIGFAKYARRSEWPRITYWQNSATILGATSPVKAPDSSQYIFCAPRPTPDPASIAETDIRVRKRWAERPVNGRDTLQLRQHFSYQSSRFLTGLVHLPVSSNKRSTHDLPRKK